MKTCIAESCKNPRFSQKLCKFHWGREQVRNPKKKKIAFGRKAVKKMTVAAMKRDLDDIYSPWVRMRDTRDDGFATCFVCGKEGRPYGENMHNGHWIKRALAPSLIFTEWNTHCICWRCNKLEPPEYTTKMQKLYGVEKVEWFISQQHSYSWKPTAFEMEILIKDYIRKFLEQCARLNHEPTVKERKIIDKYTTKNLEMQA